MHSTYPLYVRISVTKAHMLDTSLKSCKQEKFFFIFFFFFFLRGRVLLEIRVVRVTSKTIAAVTKVSAEITPCCL